MRMCGGRWSGSTTAVSPAGSSSGSPAGPRRSSGPGFRGGITLSGSCSGSSHARQLAPAGATGGSRPGPVLPLARIPTPPNAQSSTPNFQRPACAHRQIWLAMLDTISVRADAARLRASSAALSNHETRTAKSRELRSPALCLRPLGVGKPTRQPTALGDGARPEGQPDSSVIISLHSAPFPSHQAHALPHRAAKQNRGTVPKARCLLTPSTPLRYAS
jgi:hypothetical protein